MATQDLARDRQTPWAIGLAIAIGLLAQAFAGPLAGIAGATVGAVAGGAVHHFTEEREKK